MARDPLRTDKQNQMLGSAACWPVPSALDLSAQLASESATPDIANQYPEDGNYDQEYKTGEGNEYTHRIFHRKIAVYGGVDEIKVGSCFLA
jgi:hypothetical protein